MALSGSSCLPPSKYKATSEHLSSPALSSSPTHYDFDFFSNMPLRAAIIGAGVCGLISIKQCLDDDIEPVCFEAQGHIGGMCERKITNICSPFVYYII